VTKNHVFCYQIGGFDGTRYGYVYRTLELAYIAAKREYRRLAKSSQSREAKAGFECCLDERYVRITTLEVVS